MIEYADPDAVAAYLAAELDRVAGVGAVLDGVRGELACHEKRVGTLRVAEAVRGEEVAKLFRMIGKEVESAGKARRSGSAGVLVLSLIRCVTDRWSSAVTGERSRLGGAGGAGLGMPLDCV